MKLKDTVVVLATSASFASDLIHIDKRHLHSHNEPETPTFASTGFYVYGKMINLSTTKVSYTGFATLATML